MSRRQAAAESYSARMGEARRLAMVHCADFFERSGVHYDCLKTVHDTVKPELERIHAERLFGPYNLDTPNMLRRIGDEVHNRWKEAVQKCVDCGVTVFASSDNHTGRCTGCQRKQA